MSSGGALFLSLVIQNSTMRNLQECATSVFFFVAPLFFTNYCEPPGEVTIYKFPDRLVMLFDYSAAARSHSNYPMRLLVYMYVCALSLLPHADELAAREDDKLLAFHLVITLSCNVCLIILLACFLFYCDSSPAQTKWTRRTSAETPPHMQRVLVS